MVTCKICALCLSFYLNGLLYASVLEAVRRKSIYAQTTELEVEKCIKQWFHLAGEHEGGTKRTHLTNSFIAWYKYCLVF